MEKLHKKGITDKKMNFRYTTRKQEYTNQQNPSIRILRINIGQYDKGNLEAKEDLQEKAFTLHHFGWELR